MITCFLVLFDCEIGAKGQTRKLLLVVSHEEKMVLMYYMDSAYFYN